MPGFSYDLLMDTDPMDALLALHNDTLHHVRTMRGGTQQQQQHVTKIYVDYDISFEYASGSHEPSLDAYDLGGSDDIDVMVETHVRSRGRSDDLSDGDTNDYDVDDTDEVCGQVTAEEKPAPRKRRKKNAEQKCSAVGCREDIKLTARNDGEHPLCEMHKRAAVARCCDGAELCFCFYCNKAHGVEVWALPGGDVRLSHSSTKKYLAVFIRFFFHHPLGLEVVTPPGVSLAWLLDPVLTGIHRWFLTVRAGVHPQDEHLRPAVLAPARESAERGGCDSHHVFRRWGNQSSSVCWRDEQQTCAQVTREKKGGEGGYGQTLRAGEAGEGGGGEEGQGREGGAGGCE
jgi:hypothetical protein